MESAFFEKIELLCTIKETGTVLHVGYSIVHINAEIHR